MYMSREVRIRARDFDDESSFPNIFFPPSFDSIMADMRSVAKANTGAKKRHPHLKSHDDEGDAVEEEEMEI